MERTHDLRSSEIVVVVDGAGGLELIDAPALFEGDSILAVEGAGLLSESRSLVLGDLGSRNGE